MILDVDPGEARGLAEFAVDPLEHLVILAARSAPFGAEARHEPRLAHRRLTPRAATIPSGIRPRENGSTPGGRAPRPNAGGSALPRAHRRPHPRRSSGRDRGRSLPS